MFIILSLLYDTALTVCCSYCMILSLLYDVMFFCHNKCQNDVSIVSVITCIEIFVLWVYVIIHNFFLQLMPAACVDRPKI